MQRRLHSECLPNSTPGTKSVRAWGTTPIRLLFALMLALAVPSLHAATVSSDIPLGDYVHTVWTQHDGVPLGAIYTILQTADGYWWIFTGEGPLRFDGMRFVSPWTPCARRVTREASSPDGGLWAICGDRLVRRTATGQFVQVSQKFLQHRPLLFTRSSSIVKGDRGSSELNSIGLYLFVDYALTDEGNPWGVLIDLHCFGSMQIETLVNMKR